VFDAALLLTRLPLGGRSLAGALLRHPAMTAQTIVSIYWQALRLWIKRAPFNPHPESAPTELETEARVNGNGTRGASGLISVGGAASYQTPVSNRQATPDAYSR
jgi:hypothetical protein